MEAVARHCAVVAMDVKLPTATGRAYWSEHRRFLSAAGSKAFVKVVVEESSTLDEFSKAVSLAAESSPKPIFVIQPATPFGPARAPSAEQLAHFFSVARKELPDVRILPQQHKMWNVR
jgi:hypothetical protein